MKRVFLLNVTMMFCMTGVYSQNPLEATTKDGRNVVLKPDGTWEFKKVAPRPAPSPKRISTTPTTIDSFPARLSGDDTAALYSKLEALGNSMGKGEFETTTQYESRIKEKLQVPIIDNLKISDSFSFVISKVQADYDADSQVMRFFLPVSRNRRAESRIGRSLTSASWLSEFNLFSIRLNENRPFASEVRMFFNDLNGLAIEKRYDYEGFAVKVSLTVDEAMRLQATANTLVVVKFLEPYAAREQFQVSLIDVFFFDPKTGNILGKANIDMGLKP